MSDFRIDLPRRLYTAEQVRAIDRCAIEQFLIPGLVLMERAGASCFRLIRGRWPQSKVLCVVCGAGNNAGDGYVIALLARQAGLKVTLIQLGEVRRLKGDAGVCAQKALEGGVAVTEIGDANQLMQQAEVFKRADVIVDALLGTGLNGPVRPLFRQAIELINQGGEQGRAQNGAKVFAVDLPSGLCADTGQVLGDSVCAALTNTFIGMKRGLLTGQGPARAGQVLFDSLGVTEDVYQTVDRDLLGERKEGKGTCDAKIKKVERIDGRNLGLRLGGRAKDSHKGKFGHVLVVGGNHAMAGAVAMAGEAALRVGAGVVCVATRPENGAVITARRPEIMVHGIEQPHQLAPLIEKASVVVLGPGLGKDAWARQLFAAVVDCHKPLLLDADGLNALAANGLETRNASDDPLREHAARRWVLTPHPGEAGRLLACESGEVGRDRFQAVSRLQKKYGATVVLKGAGTLIATAKSLSLASVGNPGMASAGMGDVLSGIIGGLLAQGLDDNDAARLGVVLHGCAADMAAQEKGERGLLATDLFPYLRTLVNL